MRLFRGQMQLIALLWGEDQGRTGGAPIGHHTYALLRRSHVARRPDSLTVELTPSGRDIARHLVNTREDAKAFYDSMGDPLD